MFKLSGGPAGRRIGGSTAAQMAGEIPRRDAVQAGDLLFFGRPRSARPRPRAALVIRPSAQGVHVSSLDEGRLRDEFAWGRRVL